MFELGRADILATERERRVVETVRIRQILKMGPGVDATIESVPDRTRSVGRATRVAAAER
jgi:hypothetical protein